MSVILSYLKEKEINPSQSGFLSLPKEITDLEVGNSKDVSFIEASIAIKKDNIATVQGIVGMEFWQKYLKNPFDLESVKTLTEKVGANNLKSWAYFIGSYKIGEKTFTYLLPRNFTVGSTSCKIERSADNQNKQKVFNIEQKLS